MHGGGGCSSYGAKISYCRGGALRHSDSGQSTNPAAGGDWPCVAAAKLFHARESPLRCCKKPVMPTVQGVLGWQGYN